MVGGRDHGRRWRRHCGALRVVGGSRRSSSISSRGHGSVIASGARRSSSDESSGDREEHLAHAPTCQRRGSLRRCAPRNDGKRFAGIIAWSTLALAVSLWSAARADDAQPPVLTGEQARDRVVGNTLEGTTADGPYTLFMTSDGHLVSTDRDGRVDGTWTFRDGKLCTVLPDEDEECRALEVSGPSGAFVDSDGSRYTFTITPGDPKGL